MKENFPNLASEIDFQLVQEAQRMAYKLNPRKHTPRQKKKNGPNERRDQNSPQNTTKQ